MKKAIKVLAVLSAVLLIAASFGACKKKTRVPTGGHVEDVDTDKTQIYVYSYNGGYGADWLYGIKEKFEEKIHPDDLDRYIL